MGIVRGVGIVRGGGVGMGKARAMDRASLPAWIRKRLAAPSLTICMHVHYTTGRRARDPLSFIQKSQQIYRMYKHVLVYTVTGHVYLQCTNYVEYHLLPL